MSGAASCRILVVSPTAARAHQFVERVQALPTSRRSAAPAGQTQTEEPKFTAQTSVSTNRDTLAPGSSTSIPWTIVNKYYTAEVHFETHEFEHFRAHHSIGVPAIIYVWSPGEAYREHIPEIARKVQHYEPEVSLAVRFGGASTTVPSSSTFVDDDGLDEFLSSHGFEFIEGDRSYRRPTQERDEFSDDEDSGIPGLPRVIDALSTMMWPSLVQSEATQKRKSRARDMIGWAFEQEEDDGLRALIAAEPAVGSSDLTESQAAAARKSRMQREMEELQRWLEDEEVGSGLRYSRGRSDGAPAHVEAQAQTVVDKEAQTWVSSAPVASVEGWEDILTPPAIRTPRAEGGIAEEHGFEDDFADFVSAVSHPRANTVGEDRLLEVNYDIERLMPTHTGMSYRSLGSVSDFGGEDSMTTEGHGLGDGGYGTLGDGDEDDPDLPSHAEVLETSRRIFGAAAFSPVPEISTTSATATGTSALQGLASSTPGSAPQHSSSLDDASLDSEEGDDSFAAFDLSRVFSALQGMKEEIAGMEDENERRRAAARVALGLVYGLEAEGDQPGNGASDP